MSASGARLNVPRSLLVAVFAALATSADAAALVLKIKDNDVMRSKSAVTVDGTVPSTMKDNSQVYNLHVVNFTNVANITDIIEEDDATNGDDEALSAVWYLAAFGGLVLFFFVVTCSELFFGNPIYTRRPVDLPHAGYLRRHVYGVRNHQQHGQYVPETPPPPYHLFAPPSYDDTVKEGVRFHVPGSKKMADVYVVPVHAAAASGPTAATDVKILAAVLPQTKFQ